MSTWDSGTYDNDYAMDWVQDLLETKNLELIETTLDNVIEMSGMSDGEDVLPAPFAAEALVAIDVIARLQGHRGDAAGGETDEEIDAWVARCKRKVNPPLIGKAHQAIALVLSDQSELNQLWRESDDYDAWRAGVDALGARLHP
jgi:hypothetical protein